MRVSRLLHRLTIALFFVAAGCATLDQPLRELPRLSLPHQPRVYETIQHDKELARRFLGCSGETYGEPSPGEPADVGSGPGVSSAEPEVAADRAATLVDRVVRDLHITVDEARHDLRERVTDLVDLGGRDMTLGPLARRLKGSIDSSQHKLELGRYTALLAAMPQLVEHLHARIRYDEDRMAQTGSRVERLLVAYNKGYFGEITFKVAPEEAQRGAAGMTITGVVRSASDGFVDRSGATLVFPGVSADVLVAKNSLLVQAGSADSRRVASDLARIFLEALFDAAFQVPAAERATALKIAGYPKFDANSPPIPVDDFAKVTTDALRAEAAATSHVGELVRGGGGLGINNETLASVIETAAGVIAKKLTEHELFCYYLVTSGKGRADRQDARGDADRIAASAGR